MDNPRPEGADKERLERMIDSLLYANAEEGIDLCFSFDTTGSMYACLEKVRQNISSTCTKLLADIPKLRIGAQHPLSYALLVASHTRTR